MAQQRLAQFKHWFPYVRPERIWNGTQVVTLICSLPWTRRTNWYFIGMPKFHNVRSLSCNLPDAVERHTRNLLRPQLTKPNLSRFHGRTDEIIVLSIGEKFNLSPSEEIMAGHHLLSGAIIVGLARFPPALLFETRARVDLRTEAVIEHIWLTVEQANP